MADEALPFVSIIMPIRNEAEFIERAIQSILNNDYPPDKMEVLVVDGMSDDGTRDIVQRLSGEDRRIKLLDNPRRIIPSGLNIGIKACRGDIYTRIDGHAEVPPNFIGNSIKCLREHPEAWVVGGYIETIGLNYIGWAIAAAMSSPIGVGNARFRLGGYEGWVDTLAFGTHHKWILDKIGYFDEELPFNEDDEFNLRILLAGGKIWSSNSIRSRYFARGCLRKLWRQYFRYGFGRIRTLQKHKKVASFRQLVPLLFVTSLIVLSGAGFLWTLFWWLLDAQLVIYALGLLYGVVDVGRKAGWKYASPAPLIFTILHFAYGLGSLWGFIQFVIFRGKRVQKLEKMKLSR